MHTREDGTFVDERDLQLIKLALEPNAVSAE